MTIHEIMHQLCLRAGKEVYEWEGHWIKHIGNASMCLLCEQIIHNNIFHSEYPKLREAHALQHLKEKNLLPLI